MSEPQPWHDSPLPWINDPRPWHDDAWRRFRSALDGARVPHALLLAGPAGLGKQLFAYRVAAALLCSTPGDDGDACGACRGCRHFAAGSHPDFTRMRLLLKGETLAGKKLAGDSTVLRIDQVRELGEILSLSARSGGVKIAVIDPADQLNREAANALLKTLEEPTQNTLIILVAARPWRLPPTVRSRCQVLAFRLPQQAQALGWLTSRMPEGAGDAATLLAAAGGAPHTALALAESGDAIAFRGRVFAGFRDVVHGRAEPLAVAADWSRNEPKKVFDWLRGWLVELVRMRSHPSLAQTTESADLAGDLQELAQRIDLRLLFSWLDQVQQRRRLLDTPVSAQLVCEELLLGWGADLRSVRGKRRMNSR